MNTNSNQSDHNSSPKDPVGKFNVELPKSIEKAGKQLGERADEAIHSASDNLTMASEKLSDGYKVASAEIRKVGSQFEGLVRSNPYTDVAASIGLGWIVGKMFRASSMHKTENK